MDAGSQQEGLLPGERMMCVSPFHHMEPGLECDGEQHRVSLGCWWELLVVVLHHQGVEEELGAPEKIYLFGFSQGQPWSWVFNSHICLLYGLCSLCY